MTDLEIELREYADTLSSGAVKEGASPLAVIRNTVNTYWRERSAATKRAEEAEARLYEERKAKEEALRQIEIDAKIRKSEVGHLEGLLRLSEKRGSLAVKAAREANAIIESVNEAVSDTCAGSPTYAEAIRGLAAARAEDRETLLKWRGEAERIGNNYRRAINEGDRLRRIIDDAADRLEWMGNDEQANRIRTAKVDAVNNPKLNSDPPVGTPMVKTFEETKRTQGIKHNIQELMWEYLHKAAITYEPYDGYNASFEHMVHCLKGCFNEGLDTHEQFNAAMLRDFGSTPPVQDVVIHVSLRSSEVTALSELIQDMPDISADAKASILRSLKG